MISKNISGPETKRLKKDIQSTFKDFGLDLVIECNKHIVNYLDVTFSIKKDECKPYIEPKIII